VIFVSGLSGRAATPSELLPAAAAPVLQSACKIPTTKQATKPPVKRMALFIKPPAAAVRSNKNA
jgi:hypothetical protein